MRAGLMLGGIDWSPLRTLKIEEKVAAAASLEEKWRVAGLSYDLSADHLFSEYGGTVFRLGLRTASEFTSVVPGVAPSNDLYRLIDRVRGIIHDWYIEHNTGDGKLIQIAWRVYLLIDMLLVYHKMDSDASAPSTERAQRLGLPVSTAGGPVPIMQYSQSQCWFAMNQLTNSWNSMRLDKEDYMFFETLRGRFSVLCFLAFPKESDVIDMAAFRDAAVQRNSDNGTGILYQATEGFLENGIAFFADVAKAFHLQNSLRILYQVVDLRGVPTRVRGMREFQSMSAEQRKAFAAWMTDALKSPQQNQWRSDFVVHFAHAMLRPAIRYRYYHNQVEGPSDQLFEVVQGVISPENAMSILYPGDNQKAIDLFQPPRTMLDIMTAPDMEMTQWVRESAILYVWALTVAQFVGITWSTIWQQLDFVAAGIPYVVHPIGSKVGYRVLRNGSTFYLYRPEEPPATRTAYVCYDLVHALFAWTSLNSSLWTSSGERDKAVALKAFFDTAFVSGQYVDRYTPEPEDPYAKHGFAAGQFARKK